MNMLGFTVCSFGFIAVFLLVVAEGNPSCDSLLPRKQLSALEGEKTLFPNSEQLAEICPGFLSFIGCYNSAVDDRPGDYDAENIVNFRGLESAFKDLCVEENPIRLSYLEHVKCLKTAEKYLPACENASNNAYETYFKTKDKDEETFDDEKECFEQGFQIGCMSDHISKMCGERVLSTYHHFMHKSRFMAGVCQNETTQVLRTKYLQQLELNDELREIYREAFSLT